MFSLSKRLPSSPHPWPGWPQENSPSQPCPFVLISLTHFSKKRWSQLEIRAGLGEITILRSSIGMCAGLIKTRFPSLALSSWAVWPQACHFSEFHFPVQGKGMNSAAPGYLLLIKWESNEVMYYSNERDHLSALSMCQKLSSITC